MVPFQGMQIHMKSDRGEIEVYLCPEEENLPGLGALSEDSAEETDSEATLNSPLKIKEEKHGDSYPDSGHSAMLSQANTPQPSTSQMGSRSPPGPTWEAPSRTGDNESDIKNVLIWESEDFGPIGNRFQQQTVDQDHHGELYSNSMLIKGSSRTEEN